MSIRHADGDEVADAGSPSTLSVHVVYEDGITRLVATGEIDASSARTFETAARQALLEEPEAIEIDLTDVQFIDSSGLRAIVALSNRAKERRIPATVNGLSPAARRVLEVTGLIDSLRRG
jgi:anti-anti-sigma factor